MRELNGWGTADLVQTYAMAERAIYLEFDIRDQAVRAP